MFTLGNKEAIVNDLSRFPITYTDNGDATSNLAVQGFGTFLAGSVVDASIIQQEYLAESFGKGTLTCPTGTEIGLDSGSLRNPVTFLLRVNTSRYSSEWATDFIKRGRPFVFELSIDQTDTSDIVANKLKEAFAEYELKFLVTDGTSGSLPFEWVETTAGVLTLTLKAGHLDLQTTTTFMKKDDAFGLNVDLSGATTFTVDNDPAVAANTSMLVTVAGGLLVQDYFAVGDSVTINGITGSITAVGDGGTGVGTITLDTALTLGTATDEATFALLGREPNVDGAYLEENVTMSTGLTDGAYTISPGERPVIGAHYVTVSWKSTSPIGGAGGWAPHANLQTYATDVANGAQSMKFTLYFNSSVFGTIASPTASSQLADIVGWLADAVV